MPGTTVRLTLDELEKQLARVESAYVDSQWRRHFGQTNGYELRRLEAARSTLMLDTGMRQALRGWERLYDDPMLRRRVSLLKRRFRWAEIESQPQIYELRNRIDQAISSFRPRVAGVSINRVERSEILRRDPDRNHRREAWLAMGPLALGIEDETRELMRRREHLAHEMGYDGFVSWALGGFGLTQEWVEAFFSEIYHLTEAPYRAWLAEAADQLSLKDGLQPWDLAFAAESALSFPIADDVRDDLLPAVLKIADGVGLGEAAAGVHVGEADIPYAALCYAIQPPKDVRVLVNPRDGRANFVLFHEFGHALHWRCMRPTSPVLQWESPIFNEAMALLWERLASEPERPTVRDSAANGQVDDYQRRWAKRTAYRLRSLVANATVEFGAYQALDDDLSDLFQNVHSTCLRVPFDLAPGWATSPFWTSHPVYLQDYVIGEAIASQIVATLKGLFGRLIGQTEVGAWLSEHLYAAGAAVPWKDKILQATGAPLGSACLAVDLACE